ncbi:S1 family peptidase [Halalkalibacter nanhaiisediminis]|uniref:Trypsin-like peptidase n=1 Tax=Halalkalibacter nanhaiisediminis TaxID=688079 RepID=A0A562QR38_9BACI|nr:serine protease [Halalkalibacter nanhaiisediminis]TWI59194.1 trypsin-like peptidase [Halalkalibacter nanhaiisediminis]
MKEDKEQFEEQKYEEPAPEDFLFDEEETEEDEKKKKRKSWFIRIVGLSIATLLVMQGVGTLFNHFSRDSIELARTSEELSEQEHIAAFKDAVVTVQGNTSRGTGFAIHPDGYILTNHHVIHQQNPLAISFPSGDLFHAEVIESNEELDIALLKVDGDNLPYLPIRERSALEQEEIYVVGNPLTQTQIVNNGEIINEEVPFQTMKISNSIFPGHSGSPVLSEEGEVVGVVYARSLSPLGSQEEGHGLAVPVERILAEIPELNQLIDSY